jgi:hypothetical protein
MASIDFEEYSGPPTDGLGIGLLSIHLVVGLYVMAGWIVSSTLGLAFYLLLLPLVAAQWRFNRRCCVLNNLESRLRFGCWRHPGNKQEGAFLLMLCDWCFQIRPSPVTLDRLSYGVVALLWFVGLVHLAELMTG